jgi:hypothetical protein
MKRVGLLAGAATLTLSGGSFADTDLEAQNDELRARISELESRLGAVESQNSDSWLTEQRATEIKGLVQDVLADADTRSSLLAQGMTAGYDDGAVIASADGNWLLRTNIHLQTRFMWNNASGQDAIGSEDDLYGFEVTRARFILSGNVVSPDWFYRITTNIGSNTAAFGPDSRAGLGDAFVGHDYGNGWRVKMGSMKTPLLREELVDSRYQLAVERSVVNYLFTGGYTDGIAADYTGDQFRAEAMFHNGISDSVFTGITNVPPGPHAALVPDTTFAIAGRFEWLAMGTWDQFMDQTSPQGEEQGLMVGGALNYQQAQDNALAEASTLILTADVSWEFGGGNVFAAVIWGNGSYASPAPDTNPLGFVVQGGYYFTEDWEAFGRYEYADLDLPGVTDVSIISFGVNRYFAGNHAKWTTDLGFALDDMPVSVPIAGWRSDVVGESGQLLLRSQVQIVF